MDRLADGRADGWTRRMDGQADRQAGRQAGRQVGKQIFNCKTQVVHCPSKCQQLSVQKYRIRYQNNENFEQENSQHCYAL